MSSSRTKEVTMARQVSMYIIRQLTKLSLPEIGRVFGRDHTTVIHSLEKVEGLIKENRGDRGEYPGYQEQCQRPDLLTRSCPALVPPLPFREATGEG